MATNKELASKILNLVGGKENVIAATNCMTRLRIRIKDYSKVSLEELKSTQGVMGVVEADTLQVVVGPGKAKKLADIFTNEFGISQDAVVTDDWKENKENIKSKYKKGPFRKALETISGIFIPLIPAIIAAGILNGFSSLIGTLISEGTLPDVNFWQFLKTFFSLIGSAFLGYFVIFTGVNAAKRFGATEALGGMVGAIVIGSQIDTISQMFGLYNEASRLESILISGKGGIIGVILGVYILSVIEKRIRKMVPDVLDIIITPLLTLLITALILILVVMPISGFLSDALVKGLSVIIDSQYAFVRVISGYILAALFLPMVLLGLHHGLIPIYAVQLEQLGGVSLFPVLAMAGAGQVGAAIAIYIKARRVKNERMQAVIAGALPAGVLGIGEPLIYGVTLPLGKPFITAGLGAGFGGAFVMLAGVTAGAWGPSGLVAIPLMQSGMKMLYYFLGILISYVAGFIITYFVIKNSEVENV